MKKFSLYRGLGYIEVRDIEVPLYLSGLIPSDSFDEALADMIHDGVNDLRNDLAKGHFEKDEGKKVWFFNFNRLGSFSNDGGDGNEDVKKSIGLDWQNNNSAFINECVTTTEPQRTSAGRLGYDVKMPNCKFYGGREQATTNLFFSL